MASSLRIMSSTSVALMDSGGEIHTGTPARKRRLARSAVERAVHHEPVLQCDGLEERLRIDAAVEERHRLLVRDELEHHHQTPAPDVGDRRMGEQFVSVGEDPRAL